ncbi:MAG: DUF6334 family protein [Holophagales bacterium]|nr:DUF6334 family protein [Holophagales bacterium]
MRTRVGNWDELVEMLDADPGPGVLRSVELLCRDAALTPDLVLDGADLFYLRLRLESADLHIRAVGATDETVIASSPSWEPKEIHDLTRHPPWDGLVGKILFRAWRSFNNKGYTDGVDLEFALDGHMSRVHIETVASSFHVSKIMLESLT